MSEAAVIKRVLADPRRAAVGLSVNDILALASRLGALDELATDVHELLQRSDDLADLKAAKAAIAERKTAAADITTLIDRIADRLIALDYAKPKEPENEQESKNTDAATARAAER
jgi:hypothetical protein